MYNESEAYNELVLNKLQNKKIIDNLILYFI